MAHEETIPKAIFEFDPEMQEVYANNVYYESSAWDLKLIFGQLDQSEGKVRVIQHTAITMPWALAKLTIYWLRGQVEVYEAVHGPIAVPTAVIPQEPPHITDELRRQDANADKVYEIFNRLRREFIASLNKQAEK